MSGTGSAFLTQGVLEHLDASVSPSHSVEYVAERLVGAGFTRIESIASLPPRGFVASHGLLVAWVDDGRSNEGFRVVGAHTDSPCLKIKPQPDAGNAGWSQIGVEIYGGILNNSWLDRDLGIAGTIVSRDGSLRPFRTAHAVARIPQLAIHLDRDVNEKGLVLDRQNHLLPLWAIGGLVPGEFVEWLAEQAVIAPSEIVSFDLALFDTQPAALIGRDRDLISSARIDNQVSCWAATEAIIARSTGSAGPTAVVALFDHEEVGSESTHGAAGPWLEWILEALHPGDRTSLHESLRRSRCLSADCAHSVHPNYVERHEPGHRPLVNQGPVLKQNANQRYATSAETAAFFVRCCEESGIAHQTFVSKNSMPCGSTIGPIASTRLGIPTVDAGVAQLSMHSAREICGSTDVESFARVLQRFVTSS